MVYLHFRIESQLHKLLWYVKTYFISEYSARLRSVDEESNGGPGWRCEKDWDYQGVEGFDGASWLSHCQDGKPHNLPQTQSAIDGKEEEAAQWYWMNFSYEHCDIFYEPLYRYAGFYFVW